MAPPRDPKIAFVGWNPFQFLHFENLAAKFDNPTLVLEKRRSADKIFNFQSLLATPHEILRCNRREMRQLDGKFDVLVCQTQFEGIEEIRKSRIAMLQYGYAKEAHNYGAWRSFADVCMTYGSYASRKMDPFCATVATGNPRFAEWANPEFHNKAREKFANRLDPAKKTLLHAPTWGPLSSDKAFSDAVLALSCDYNVILKVHHNSQRLAFRTLEPLRRKLDFIYGADDDIAELLSVSDVLLSDFSGAIFDAIQCEVPVVLLGGPAPDTASDSFSIEQARRDELGEVVLSASELSAAIPRALEKPYPRAAGMASLRNELFCDSTGAADRAAEVIRRLAEGDYGPSQSQSYIRREMTEIYRHRARFKRLRQLGRLFRF